MGVHENITHDKWPNQGSLLHKRVSICYHYDTEHTYIGKCIRDDVESPFLTIFELDNGRVVLATECQYRY